MVRNLEEGFALEFIHEQLIRDCSKRALPRGKAPSAPKPPYFQPLKAVSATADAAFFVSGAARARLTRRAFARDFRNVRTAFAALIDKI